MGQNSYARPSSLARNHPHGAAARRPSRSDFEPPRPRAAYRSSSRSRPAKDETVEVPEVPEVGVEAEADAEIPASLAGELVREMRGIPADAASESRSSEAPSEACETQTSPSSGEVASIEIPSASGPEVGPAPDVQTPASPHPEVSSMAELPKIAAPPRLPLPSRQAAGYKCEGEGPPPKCDVPEPPHAPPETSPQAPLEELEDQDPSPSRKVAHSEDQPKPGQPGLFRRPNLDKVSVKAPPRVKAAVPAPAALDTKVAGTAAAPPPATKAVPPVASAVPPPVAPARQAAPVISETMAPPPAAKAPAAPEAPRRVPEEAQPKVCFQVPEPPASVVSAHVQPVPPVPPVQPVQPVPPVQPVQPVVDCITRSSPSPAKAKAVTGPKTAARVTFKDDSAEDVKPSEGRRWVL